MANHVNPFVTLTLLPTQSYTPTPRSSEEHMDVVKILLNLSLTLILTLTLTLNLTLTLTVAAQQPCNTQSHPSRPTLLKVKHYLHAQVQNTWMSSRFI